MSWQRLDALIEQSETEGFDVAVELVTGSEAAWSCELRYTPKPNDNPRPDRSYVLYAAGGGTPLEVLTRCLNDLEVWREDL